MIDTLRAQIISTISTDGIQAMLDKIGTSYAIIGGNRLPEQYQSLNRTILVYRVSPQGAGDIRPLYYTAACRQATEYNSQLLAELVYTALNRNFYAVTGGDCYMQAVIQPAIYEDENCWQTPVEVYVRNNL